MATKFCRVDKAPEELRKDELVVSLPDFKDEIIKARRSRGQQKILTVNYLRGIFTEIAASFDPTFNPYLDINLTKYKGLPAADEDEAAAKIMDIVTEVKPDLIEKAIAKQVAARATRVKLIYFVAPDFNHTGVFTQHGIDSIKPAEINKFLGVKKTQKDVPKE